MQVITYLARQHMHDWRAAAKAVRLQSSSHLHRFNQSSEEVGFEAGFVMDSCATLPWQVFAELSAMD